MHATFDLIAENLATGVVDPVLLVEEALGRAVACDHVFIDVFCERALAEALAARKRWREGRPLSALDGVPIAWKDLFEIEGIRSSAGSLTRANGAVASRDADVVAAARRLGLVTLGVTNLSEFAYSGLGLNPHFGTPVPYWPSVSPRAPGGSSSGSAIAVQRGIVSGAIGSDTAGSVRIPAAFNGLVGFRPSLQRYSMRGVYRLSKKLDTVGPLARTARDCAWLDNILRGIGNAPDDPANLKGMCFVVENSMTTGPDVDPAVAANVMRAADHLASAGANIETRTLDVVARTLDLIETKGWIGAVEIHHRHLDVLASQDRPLIDPRVVTRMEAAERISASARAEIYAAYRSFRKKVHNELGSAVLITPTTVMTAPELAPLERDPELFARVNLRALKLTMVGSFLRMPGLALPSGVDAAGLPTSILLSAREGEDDMLLRVGMASERVLEARAHEENCSRLCGYSAP